MIMDTLHILGLDYIYPMILAISKKPHNRHNV